MDRLGRAVYERAFRPNFSWWCGKGQHMFRGHEVCLTGITDNHPVEAMHKASGYWAWALRGQDMKLSVHRRSQS